MKKIIGICLIFLGASIFYLCGYGFTAFMITNKEKFIAKYAARGQDANTFYKEGLDNHIHNGRITTGLLTLIGLGIALSGIAIFRSPASNNK